MSGEEFKCGGFCALHSNMGGEHCRFIEFECRCSLVKIVCAHCYGVFSCFPDCGLYWIDRTKRSGRNVCDCDHSKRQWCHMCRLCIVEETGSSKDKCLRNENRRYCHFFCQTCQCIHRNYCPKSSIAAFVNYK